MNSHYIAEKVGITFGEKNNPCKGWPDTESVSGMTADEIWSILNEYVRSDNGKSVVKKYAEISDYLQVLSSTFNYENKLLVNLTQAAESARQEQRWILLGDKSKVTKYNQDKWSYLNKAKGLTKAA